MKTCCICKIEKELTEYNKNRARKDGINSVCRECSNTRSKQYYKENLEKHKTEVLKRARRITIENYQNLLNYYLTHSCVDCGESDPRVLEFDHVRGKKKNNISNLIGSAYSWKIIKKEISKCDVRCANCHRRRTAKSQNWYKDVIMNSAIV